MAQRMTRQSSFAVRKVDKAANSGTASFREKENAVCSRIPKLAATSKGKPKAIPLKETATTKNDKNSKEIIQESKTKQSAAESRIVPYQPKAVVTLKEVTDIDANDHHNPFACAEYAEEIYQYLRKREVFVMGAMDRGHNLTPRVWSGDGGFIFPKRDVGLYQVSKDYIKLHPEINERMRAILVDWLIEVHEKFKLTNETLFLSISILDRYLAGCTTARKTDLQLIGVTAMFLASKIEEIYAPEISDFVYITDHTYTSSMIRSKEAKMASLLQFNFGDPLCIHFLRRNSKALQADAEKHILAKYFMELMLPDYESIVFPPSQRAAASLCLAMKITNGLPWNSTVTHYSQYTEADLRPCMKRIAQLVIKARDKDSKLVSVTKKYSRAKYGSIASSPLLSSSYIIELPED